MSTENSVLLRGSIFAAAITPIQANLTVDLPHLAKYCGDVIARGCDDVAPLGSAGEANSVQLATRLQVPEALRKGGIPADRFIIGTGACSVGDAVAMTKASLDAGYPNLLVLPPFFYKEPSEDGLYAYYDQILQQAGPSARIYLYHFPRMSTVAITTSLIQRLRHKWGPAIAGLKDSGGDFAVTKAFIECAPAFRVYSGSEQFALENLAAGGAGVISATTNVTAALVHQLIQTPSNDQSPLDENLKKIRLVLQKYSMSAMLKLLMQWHTGDTIWSTLLPPLTPLSPIEQTELWNALRAIPYFKDTFSLAYAP